MKKLDELSAAERRIVLARRDYQKKWRARNRDKVHAATQRFFERQADKQEEETAPKN